MDMFYEQVLEDGATPIIVVFPDIMTFKLKLEQDVKRHKNLLEHWKKRRYNYIDLTDHLSADKKELSGMFAKGGHYNAQGNRRVAQVLYTYVQTFQ